MGSIREDLRTLLANSVKKFHFHIEGDSLHVTKPNWGARLVTWIKSLIGHKKHVQQVNQVANKILDVVRKSSTELSTQQVEALKNKLHHLQKSSTYRSVSSILSDATKALSSEDPAIIGTKALLSEDPAIAGTKRLINLGRNKVASLQVEISELDKEIEFYMAASMKFSEFELSLDALLSLSNKDLNGDIGKSLINECYELLKETNVKHDALPKNRIRFSTPKKHLKNLKKASHMKKDLDVLLESAATDWAIADQELKNNENALEFLQAQMNDLEKRKKGT